MQSESAVGLEPKPQVRHEGWQLMQTPALALTQPLLSCPAGQLLQAPHMRWPGEGWNRPFSHAMHVPVPPAKPGAQSMAHVWTLQFCCSASTGHGAACQVPEERGCTSIMRPRVCTPPSHGFEQGDHVLHSATRQSRLQRERSPTKVVHSNSGSTVQLLLQPSPDTVLLSSHASFVVVMPSPHVCTVTELVGSPASTPR